MNQTNLMEQLKDFLDSQGVDWSQVETRLIRTDNNQTAGKITLTYNSYIDYTPNTKKDKTDEK